MINQIGTRFGAKSTRGSGTGSPAVRIASISATFKNIQRIGTPVSINAQVAGGGAVTEWFWAIRDSGHEDALGSFVDMSFSQNPTFTLANPGYYDIVLVAKNSVSTWNQTFRRAFFNFYPRFTEGQADVVFDASLGSGFFTDFVTTVRPGYKIGIKNSGTIPSFITYDLRGSSGWANHVRIQNLTDNVVITGTGGGPNPHLFLLDGDDTDANGGCRYIVCDFFNADGTNGLTWVGPPNTSQIVRVRGGGFTDIHMLGMNVVGGSPSLSAAISMVPTPSALWQAPTYSIYNMTKYRCTTTNAPEEGDYVGETQDNEDYFANNGFIPPKFIKPVTARCTFTGSGRDGDQPGGCFKFAFHDNIYNGFGQNHTDSHESAISKNPGSTGWFYKNYCKNGEMFVNDQSGKYPYNVGLGGETAISTQMLYWGNIFDTGVYSSAGTVEPYAISIKTFIGSGSATAYNPSYIHNTIVTDKDVMIFYPLENSFTHTKFTYANNLIVKKNGTLSGNTDIGAKEEVLYNTSSFIACDLMATGNIASLTGNQIIDGTLTTNGTAVFLNNQTDKKQNGPYFTGTPWARHNSADTTAEVQNAQVRIRFGATLHDTYWYQSTPAITLGVSDIVFLPKISGSVINNLVKTVATASDILFTRFDGVISGTNDLTPSSFSSPAYAGTPTDISARVLDLDPYLSVDYFGYPLKATGFDYTFGAYSGYEKRTIADDYDTVAATLSSAVAISSVGNFGFTITYEANKEGYLYYVVLADGAATPTQAQIIAGIDAAGAAATRSGRIIDAGTAGSAVITGLSQGTAYDIHSVFVTRYNVKTSGVKVDQTTTNDVTAPTIGTYVLADGDRSHITATLSESGCVFNTGSGFSVTGGRTITGGSIVGTTLTLNLSAPFVQTDYASTIQISYTAGGTPAIEDAASNDLANFGATTVTNNIAPEAAAAVVSAANTNITISGGSSNTFTQVTSTPAIMYGTKAIPTTSDGYVQFDWDTNSRSGANAVKIGMIDSSDNAVASGDCRFYMDLATANHNIDYYENVAGSSTYRNTFSTFGFNQTGIKYRIFVDRSGDTRNPIWTGGPAPANDDKIKIYASTDNFVASHQLIGTSTLTHTMALKAMVYFNAASKTAVNMFIQANKGLL